MVVSVEYIILNKMKIWVQGPLNIATIPIQMHYSRNIKMQLMNWLVHDQIYRHDGCFWSELPGFTSPIVRMGRITIRNSVSSWNSWWWIIHSGIGWFVQVFKSSRLVIKERTPNSLWLVCLKWNSEALKICLLNTDSHFLLFKNKSFWYKYSYHIAFS